MFSLFYLSFPVTVVLLVLTWALFGMLSSTAAIAFIATSFIMFTCYINIPLNFPNAHIKIINES